MVSIMDAINKHPQKKRILEEMRKPVADDYFHRAMVKAACNHLIDLFGRYPPADKRQAMAVDIIRTFPERANKSGKGYELYHCSGSSGGFLTNRLREIYRRYPRDQKKYRPRKSIGSNTSGSWLCSTSGTPSYGEVVDKRVADHDLMIMKTQLKQMVYSEKNEAEIIDLTKSTLVGRQSWIKEKSPSAAEIFEHYPRFTDTPSLIPFEFSCMYPKSRDSSSVFLETHLAPRVIKYCKSTKTAFELTSDIDLDDHAEPDLLVKAALRCLLRLLPMTGKHRVSASTAILYVLQKIEEPMSLHEALLKQQKMNDRLDRTRPYILQIGRSLFIVADGCSVVVQPPKLSVAFDILMKSFFVFNVQFPKQISVFYTFLQHALLGVDSSSLTPRAQKLANELEKL